jgi:hypothetical protein
VTFRRFGNTFAQGADRYLGAIIEVLAIDESRLWKTLDLRQV